MATKQLKTASKTVPARNAENGNAIRQTYAPDILRRAQEYQADKGLLAIQDVARLAMSFFLDKQGY